MSTEQRVHATFLSSSMRCLQTSLQCNKWSAFDRLIPIFLNNRIFGNLHFHNSNQHSENFLHNIGKSGGTEVRRMPERSLFSVPLTQIISYKFFCNISTHFTIFSFYLFHKTTPLNYIISTNFEYPGSLRIIICEGFLLHLFARIFAFFLKNAVIVIFRVNNGVQKTNVMAIQNSSCKRTADYLVDSVALPSSQPVHDA